MIDEITEIFHLGFPPWIPWIPSIGAETLGMLVNVGDEWG